MMAKTLLSPFKALASSPPRSVLASYVSYASQFHPPQQNSMPPPEEEKWRSVKVYVLWDFNSCPVPEGVNLRRASQAITKAVRANGMNGRIEIKALADGFQLPNSTVTALFLTGITTVYFPNGGSADVPRDSRRLMRLAQWSYPPVHLFVITDRDFSRTLEELREMKYNVLVASNEAQGVLCSAAASIAWRWNDLIRGDKLIGKYLRQPPDASLYGQYNVPLEEPFLAADPLMIAAMNGKKASSPFKALASSPPSAPVSHFSTPLKELPGSARVSVWWDFHSCPVPEGVNLSTVSQTIEAAVRANGICGPVQISALADVFQLPTSTFQTLSTTGISLTHLADGGRNNVSVLKKLLCWADEIPPPAHLFMITDLDLSYASHLLRCGNNKILLACNDAPPKGVSFGAASIVWRWNDLAKGESLIGKHFDKAPLFPNSRSSFAEVFLGTKDGPGSNLIPSERNL